MLSSGTLTDSEVNFVRQQAIQLGISEARYDQVLRERAGSRGVQLPNAASSGGPPAWSGGNTFSSETSPGAPLPSVGVTAEEKKKEGPPLLDPLT